MFLPFIIFLIIPSPASSNDLINTTCTQCAKKSSIFDYDFCVTSLESVPTADHVSNIQGLGIIAMELTWGNATATVTTIERMLTGESFDTFNKICLMNCMELYAETVCLLVNSIGAFLTQQYDTVDLLMSAVLEISATCEEGFNEKDRKINSTSPLTKENYNLFELSEIAMCINSLII